MAVDITLPASDQAAIMAEARELLAAYKSEPDADKRKIIMTSLKQLAERASAHGIVLPLDTSSAIESVPVEYAAATVVFTAAAAAIETAVVNHWMGTPEMAPQLAYYNAFNPTQHYMLSLADGTPLDVTGEQLRQYFTNVIFHTLPEERQEAILRHALHMPHNPAIRQPRSMAELEAAREELKALREHALPALEAFRSSGTTPEERESIRAAFSRASMLTDDAIAAYNSRIGATGENISMADALLIHRQQELREGLRGVMEVLLPQASHTQFTGFPGVTTDTVAPPPAHGHASPATQR